MMDRSALTLSPPRRPANRVAVVWHGPSAWQRFLARSCVAAVVAFSATLALNPVLAQDSVDPPRPADVEPLTADQFREVLAAHRGVVTLVNLWATWCAPCLREIPELLELEADLGDRGFRLVAVSLDDADAADKIREFRDEWFPELRTYHNQTLDWFDLIESLDPDWIGVLPSSFLLNRDGEVVDTITGGQDYATFEAAILPYL